MTNGETVSQCQERLSDDGNRYVCRACGWTVPKEEEKPYPFYALRTQGESE